MNFYRHIISLLFLFCPLIAMERESTDILSQLIEQCSKGNIIQLSSLLERYTSRLTQEDLNICLFSAISGWHNYKDELYDSRDTFCLVCKTLITRGADVNALLDGKTLLMRAAQVGYHQIMPLLLAKGAAINTQDKKGNTALTYALFAGYKGIVQGLINCGALPAADSLTNSAINTFFYLVIQGKYNEVKALLDQGFNVNTQADGKCTALVWASAYGHTELVRLLIAYGAKTSIIQALKCACLYGRHEIVEVLFSQFKNTLSEKILDELLLTATSSNHYAVVEFLCKQRDSLEWDIDASDYTPLASACRNGYKEIVELLLKYGAYPREYNDPGAAPILLAARYGHLAIVETLLNSYPDLLSDQEFCNHVVVAALCSGNTSLVKFLIKRGVNFATIQDENEWPALFVAFSQGHKALIPLLIEAGADYDEDLSTEENNFLKAVLTGDIQGVQSFVTCSATSDVQGQDDYSPLILASFTGHVPVVENLLAAGANVNYTVNNNSALSLAVQGGNLLVAAHLIAAGADITEEVLNTVHRYRQSEFFPLLMGSKVLQAGYLKDPVAFTSKFLETLEQEEALRISGIELMLTAASLGHVDILQKLGTSKFACEAIKSLLTINLKGFSETPLTSIFKCCSKEVLDCLLHSSILDKYVLNVPDRNGNTALYYAVCRKDHNLVIKLLESGAQVSLKVLKLAADTGCKETTILFLFSHLKYPLLK